MLSSGLQTYFIASSVLYGGPKGSITNQFTKTQNNFLKQKSIFQNTKQFPKTQNNFPKHKSVYQNIKQFLKTQISLPKHKTISQNTTNFVETQISLPKHKTISQNTNQFTKTQINFSKHKPISLKHKSKDWALALLLSESLERTHFQDFPRPTWRLQICCR